MLFFAFFASINTHRQQKQKQTKNIYKLIMKK